MTPQLKDPKLIPAELVSAVTRNLGAGAELVAYARIAADRDEFVILWNRPEQMGTHHARPAVNDDTFVLIEGDYFPCARNYRQAARRSFEARAERERASAKRRRQMAQLNVETIERPFGRGF